MAGVVLDTGEQVSLIKGSQKQASDAWELTFSFTSFEHSVTQITSNTPNQWRSLEHGLNILKMLCAKISVRKFLILFLYDLDMYNYIFC